MDNEPDIIQKLSADFNVVNDISIDFSTSPVSIKMQNTSETPVNAQFDSNVSADIQLDSPSIPFEAQFGTIYVVSGDCRVLYATTATWNSQPQLISQMGYIYIYSDYRKNDQGADIPSMKVGDGNAYLIDMPFSDEVLYKHVDDNVRHITQQEREFWNNKVRCYTSEVQNDVPFPRVAGDGNNIGIIGVDTVKVSVYVPNAFNDRITDIYITLRYTKSLT